MAIRAAAAALLFASGALVACGDAGQSGQPGQSGQGGQDGQVGASGETGSSVDGQQAADDRRTAWSSDERGAPKAGRSGDDSSMEQQFAMPSAVKWHEGGLEEALAAAAKQKKKVVLKVGAYWCPPCQTLDVEVFSKQSFADALEAWAVPVHVDVERDDGRAVAERYSVMAYPTMLVLDGDGNELGRVVDAHPADELAATLKSIAEGQDPLEARAAALAAKPEDVGLKMELADAYANAAKRDKADQLFKEIEESEASKSPPGEYAAKAKYARAIMILDKLDKKPLAAITELRDLQKLYPDSKEARRAYRQLGRMLHRLGRSAEAMVELEAMLALGPSDADVLSNFVWFSFRERCGTSRGLEVAKKAATLFPDNAEFAYLQAELHEQLGHSQEALVSIRRALEIEPASAFYARQVERFEAAAAGTAPAGDDSAKAPAVAP